MPIREGVGQSDYTPRKQQILQAILRMHISITQSVIAKYAYYEREYLYLDCTAGPGLYGDRGERITGSPVIFLQCAEEKTLAYTARFIEEDQRHARRLKRIVAGCKQRDVVVRPGSYDQELPRVGRIGSGNQLGLLYIDPNGIPHWEPIKHILDANPKIEVLIHLSATALKRVPGEPSLAEVLQILGKQHWLIRQPFKGDPQQWTFLLGSNTQLFGKYKKIDFYPLESPEAQAFFDRINLTKNQREHLGQLDFLHLAAHPAEEG
ncbi:MAG: three-Cys-motif partner protein TcmP [Anaerolineales bacterium]|nr:three-Cys-motif partner protein TcmP [Anaerolineales bacterium]